MSTLNPLNDISRTYLDTIAKMNKREEETEVKRWEGELNLQMKTQASLNNEAVYGKTPAQVEASRRKKDNLAGAPLTVTNADKKANTKAYQNYKAGVKGYKAADHMGEGHSMNIQGKKNCGCGQDPCVTYGKQDKKSMKEEKKAKKDYDGDGKIESGKDEYFGSKDKAIKKAMGKKSPEAIEAKRRKDDDLAGSPLKKEETANSYVQAYVAELNKTTMGSYVKKASKDLSDRRFDQGDSEKRKYDPDAADDKEEMKLRQREKGISRAATKLSKEELELDEAERDLGDRLHRKRKLYDKTTKKAMEYARREGEAAGHDRFNMGRLDREMDKVKDKMNKEK